MRRRPSCRWAPLRVDKSRSASDGECQRPLVGEGWKTTQSRIKIRTDLHNNMWHASKKVRSLKYDFRANVLFKKSFSKNPFFNYRYAAFSEKEFYDEEKFLWCDLFSSGLGALVNFRSEHYLNSRTAFTNCEHYIKYCIFSKGCPYKMRAMHAVKIWRNMELWT